MLVREFKPHELPIVVGLFQRAVREVNIRDYSPAQVQAWAPDTPDFDAWRARLSSGLVLVCEAPAGIAGFLRLEGNGHIDLLYVDSVFQRQGVASTLLEKTLEWAALNQLQYLFTEASITARPFFERFLFQVARSQKVTLREMTFENFVMERNL